MKWSAQIYLKSGKHIVVQNLTSIMKEHLSDEFPAGITDFKAFKLCILSNEALTFVGEKNIVAIKTDEIEYVNITADS